eukprot:CAMPEP_0115828276 /NCGR_PEP_ID=MMETSP0287-20121206/487_1 /TAXON_ID=412157 /ORGANISM="Chrysochromulina rotalis, Strain UIO044" /LENGTH=527 /DNA_ID=CAMNT_0003281481 /DNA_START=1 /DNA_END=1584 /DNA_ORIENTATION=-
MCAATCTQWRCGTGECTDCDVGRYFIVNSHDVESSLGRPFAPGIVRAVQLRTGRDQLVRLWSHNTSDYGNVHGRWEPATDSRIGDWELDDEIIFVRQAAERKAAKGEVRVLSIDFVRANRPSPLEKGRYFSLESSQVETVIGRQLVSGETHRVVQLRTGREQLVRLWAPHKRGVTSDYLTVGDVQGRWEPSSAANPGDWHAGDAVVFVQAAHKGRRQTVLSIDFVRGYKPSPRDRGKYFGISQSDATRILGQPLTSGTYRIVQPRTGRDQLARIWVPVMKGLTSDYMMAGDAQGRWEVHAEPGDWQLGDEVVWMVKSRFDAKVVAVGFVPPTPLKDRQALLSWSDLLAVGLEDESDDGSRAIITSTLHASDGSELEDPVEACRHQHVKHVHKQPLPSPRQPSMPSSSPRPPPWPPNLDDLRMRDDILAPRPPAPAPPPAPPELLFEQFWPSPPLPVPVPLSHAFLGGLQGCALHWACESTMGADTTLFSLLGSFLGIAICIRSVRSLSRNSSWGTYETVAGLEQPLP